MGTWSVACRGARKVRRARHGLRVGDLLPRAEKKISERFGGGRVTGAFALDLRRFGGRLGSLCHKSSGRERSRRVSNGAVCIRATPEQAHADVACTRSSLYPPQAMPCPVRAHGLRGWQPGPGRTGRGNRVMPRAVGATPIVFLLTLFLLEFQIVRSPDATWSQAKQVCKDRD